MEILPTLEAKGVLAEFNEEAGLAGIKAAPEVTCRVIGLCDRPQCRLWDASSPSSLESNPLLKKEFMAVLPKLSKCV